MIPIVEAVAVSQYVDSRIEYREDEWRNPNLWQKYVDAKGADYTDDSTPAYGDCDDYAASKRRILLEKGYSPKDMRLTSTAVPGKYYPMHMVLLVNTERGWYALDIKRFYKFTPNFRDVSLIDGKWRYYRTWDGEVSQYSTGMAPSGWNDLCAKKEARNEADYDCDVVKPGYGIHIEFIR